MTDFAPGEQPPTMCILAHLHRCVNLVGSNTVVSAITLSPVAALEDM